MPRLLDNNALENSSVVANCTMNRERSLSGYNRELGLNIMTELTNRSENSPRIRWLDLCCGTGRALEETTRLLAHRGLADQIEIVGLDLVDHFTAVPTPPTLRLITHSVTDWAPKTDTTWSPAYMDCTT
ncbi:class I SAM-dependent methyltransferase [Actinomadura sp. J1-007]|uniref:class I SAM-dependent methyltransferase n=1 Tax=Actinomadura sp. J1-007 TaxID=2661913 RepID=UPI0019D5C576|nr:class I SAM-dependent methyltransferase [Actinomadura sp. J1-007]